MCRPFVYSFDSRKNVFWMTRFAIDMMIAVSSAMPKLEISKELPIKLSVSISVMALMTNKNSPRLSTVTGSVSRIKIGLTRTFKMERMKLAPKAAPKPARKISFSK